MNVIYDVVEVRVAELNTMQVEIPQWETPVLQAMYGSTAVKVGELVVASAASSPDEEFARLSNKYGPRAANEIKFVAAAYGSFAMGVAALGNAMRNAVTAAPLTRVPQFVSEEAKQRYLVQEESAQLDAEINKKAREAMIAKYDADIAAAQAATNAIENKPEPAADSVADLLDEVA